MGVKKRNSYQLNWSATQNVPYSPNTPASGVVNGAMSGTNTIYSNVQDISNFDNEGLEITYAGTATGTISVLCSESGSHFYPLTFDPVLTQPSGSSGGYLVDLNNVPWRYVMIQYVNASGSGTLSIWLGSKDVN